MAQVFVVDRDAFFGGDWPQGFTALTESEAPAFLTKALLAGRFVERAEAETNPAWKQWIPYCAIRCQAEVGKRGKATDGGLFVVQRTGGQSEARLHGSWSIGLGGHVEPEDRDPMAPGAGDGAQFFAAALWRELTEELRFEGNTAETGRLRLLGLINDDSSPVGKVHAGLAYCLDLALPLLEARRRVEIGEISKMRGGFTSLVEFAELWQDPARFESWSRVFIEAGIVTAMGDKSLRGTISALADQVPRTSFGP